MLNVHNAHYYEFIGAEFRTEVYIATRLVTSSYESRYIPTCKISCSASHDSIYVANEYRIQLTVAIDDTRLQSPGCLYTAVSCS